MAIDTIVTEVMEKKKAVLEIESADGDALDDIADSLRRLSPYIVIDREGLTKTDPNKLIARITVCDDSYEWVRERLTSALSDNIKSIKLLDK